MKKTHWWGLGGLAVGYLVGKAGGFMSYLRRFTG